MARFESFDEVPVIPSRYEQILARAEALEIAGVDDPLRTDPVVWQAEFLYGYMGDMTVRKAAITDPHDTVPETVLSMASTFNGKVLRLSALYGRLKEAADPPFSLLVEIGELQADRTAYSREMIRTLAATLAIDEGAA